VTTRARVWALTRIIIGCPKMRYRRGLEWEKRTASSTDRAPDLRTSALATPRRPTSGYTENVRRFAKDRTF